MSNLQTKKICDKCGKIHVSHWGTPGCSAHLSGVDPAEPCSRPPTAGLNVCRAHGAVGLARRVARERIELLSAQGEIGELLRDVDIPDQDPVAGLLEVVRVSGSMMRLLTVKVSELAEDPDIKEVLVEGPNGELSVKEKTDRQSFWGLDKDAQMAIHPYVKLLREWTERYERACKTCLDAGIAERQVKLAENQGEMLAQAVRGILTALNLTPEQWQVAPVIVAKHLKELA